jgi:hypothetical protein
MVPIYSPHDAADDLLQRDASDRRHLHHGWAGPGIRSAGTLLLGGGRGRGGHLCLAHVMRHCRRR